MKKNITVVVFDLDGLLVNSQPWQFKAYSQAFSEYGHELTRDDWQIWIDDSISAQEYMDIKGLNLDAETVNSRKKELYSDYIENNMEMREGAMELVNALYSKYGLCIASSSRLDCVELVVNRFGIEDKIEKLISDRDLPKSKPHPMVYEEAARQMGVKPSECVAIEDSISGHKAVEAAGMTCIVCPDPYANVPIEKYNNPRYLINNLTEAIGIITAA